MAKEPIEYLEYYEGVCRALRERGGLLLSVDPDGKLNPMTIGWGTIGVVWSRPIWVVLVRHSRYTYQCLEHTGDFTVNVPTLALQSVAHYCGTVSGRDADKMREQQLTARPSERVTSPGIDECAIIYECKVVQKTDVVPETFDPTILEAVYGDRDFHRVYFGEVLHVVADRPLAESL